MMSVLRHYSRRCLVLPNATSVLCNLCNGFSHCTFPIRNSSVQGLSYLATSRTQDNGLLGAFGQYAMSLNYQPRRNAGHSKWANIRHVKQANDMARSKELTKYVNFMKAAIRESGSADPKQNAKLAQIISQVKEAKLPMATIDRFLQSAQARKDSSNCIHPIKGPGNCIMLVDIESTNLMKTKQELNTVLRKNRAIVAEDSVLYLFDHKGILLCSEIDGKPASEELLDEATVHAIEGGANDVEFHKDHPEFGDVFEFITEPSAFFKVKGVLENLKYTIVNAEVAYIPKKWLELDDDELDAANKLYAKLAEHPDVQKVFVNIA